MPGSVPHGGGHHTGALVVRPGRAGSRLVVPCIQDAGLLSGFHRLQRRRKGGRLLHMGAGRHDPGRLFLGRAAHDTGGLFLRGRLNGPHRCFRLGSGHGVRLLRLEQGVQGVLQQDAVTAALGAVLRYPLLSGGTRHRRSTSRFQIPGAYTSGPDGSSGPPVLSAARGSGGGGPAGAPA